MKCKHCNEEIKEVMVHFFTYDGADSYERAEILGGEEESCYYISVSKDATMFEFEDYYSDFMDNISCEKCNQNPFSGKSVTTYNFAHVVFGVSKEPYINEQEHTNEDYKPKE